MITERQNLWGELRCCFGFCPRSYEDEDMFVARSKSTEDRNHNFNQRLDHIYTHIQDPRCSGWNMKEHLRDNDDRLVLNCWTQIWDAHRDGRIDDEKFKRLGFQLRRHLYDPQYRLLTPVSLVN
jgi:hypothetical protein